MTSNESSESLENTCVVCFKDVDIYSVGDCDHPVCYECSTRMRVLCQQNECPICRQDMPKVVFTTRVQPFRTIKHFSYLMDKKFKICFENSDVQAAYNTLLEHVCSECSNRPMFRTFQLLKEHMKREHELQYCELCVDNLRIFTGERRCYTRQELALHRRKGDPDDRSHRGHPICEFCDQRYMDNDELFRHLRRDHLFCHFCDIDGYHQYYSSYEYLRDHFRTDHYLCEEGECVDEKFTSVFRTEIDLKAHRASIHGRTIGKAAVKQARTLELEFTLARRPRDRERADSGMRGSRKGGTRTRNRHEDDEEEGAFGGEPEDVEPTFPTPSQINTNCIEEFPTLCRAPASPVVAPMQKSSARGGVTIRSVRQSKAPPAVTDENFPALGPEAPGSSSSCKTVRLSVNSSQDRTTPRSSSAVATKAPTNVSIHVNHRPNGAVMTRLSSSQNFRIRPVSGPPQLSDDFPSLSSPHVPSPTHWVGSQPPGTKAKAHVQIPQTKKSFRAEEDFPSLVTKFSTSCKVPDTATASSAKSDVKSKKASSVVIPVSNWAPAAASNPGPSYKRSESPAEMNGTSGKSKENSIANPSNSSAGDVRVKSKKKKSKTTVGYSGSNNNSELNSSMKLISGNKEASGSNSHDKRKNKTATSDFEELLKQQLLSKTKKEEPKKQNREKSNDNNINSKTERKRSELLITNLISQESSENLQNGNLTNNSAGQCSDKNVISLDSTTNPGSSVTWPPQIPNVSKAPPGFEGNQPARAPPPGFSVPVSLNSIARPQPNLLTFTNSSGQNYPIHPKGSSFLPPPKFEARNMELVSRVMEALPNPTMFDKFRQVSALFKQGALSAQSFYTHCMDLMGQFQFKDIFPELLVLLPDISKQQELWSLYATLSSGDNTERKFEHCSSCGQVLSPLDLLHHLDSHKLQNCFSSSTTPEPVSNSWGKK